MPQRGQPGLGIGAVRKHLSRAKLPGWDKTSEYRQRRTHRPRSTTSLQCLLNPAEMSRELTIGEIAVNLVGDGLGDGLDEERDRRSIPHW